LKKEKAKKLKSALREYVELFAETAIFVLFINTFVAQASQVPTPSMEDTILVGDFMFINRFAYTEPVAKILGNGNLTFFRNRRHGITSLLVLPE